MIKNKKLSILASCGLIFATIIWGFAFIVVKDSLNTVPPMFLIAFRFSIAALFLGFFCVKDFRKLNKKALISGVVTGLFLFLAYVFQTVGLQYTTPGNNAFLTTTYVLFVPLLNWAIAKKKPKKKFIIAAVLAIFGIALLSLDMSSGFTFNIGDFLTLICGVCFALQIVFIEKAVDKLTPLMLTFLQMTTSAVLGWILAPLFGETFPVSAFSDLQTIFSVLYLGILSTMLCFFLQTFGQKYTRATTSSILLSFESVFGCFFSILFGMDTLRWEIILGAILMLAAVIISEVDFKRKNR